MEIEQELRKFEIFCEESLNKYLTLIKVENYDGYCESHHILPRSMYPEYAKSSWNLVRLNYKNHVYAHELLAKFFNNSKMKRAYSFIGRHIVEKEKLKFLTSGCFKGELNPSKRPEVRKKISDAKIGKPRLDLVGKKYFGANDESIQLAIKYASSKLVDTVIVKDSNGNRFRVSVNDNRYISGELIPFNKGEKRPNSASKTPEIMAKIMKSRNEKYSKFLSCSLDELVQLLVDAHKNGKRIFSKGKRAKSPFGPNYSSWVNMSLYDNNVVKDAVVQRLSKG